MNEKRPILVGHLLASLLIVLLLAGARKFLAAQPLLSAMVLALFAPVYFAAARVMRLAEFLYGGALLLVLSWQLLVHWATGDASLQPLGAVVPLAVLLALAHLGVPRSIEGGPRVLARCHDLVVVLFAIWTAVAFRTQFAEAAVATAAALIAFGVLLWLRFLREQLAVFAAAAVVAGTGGFAFLVEREPAAALALGGAATVIAVARLVRLRRIEEEAIAFVVPVALFAFAGMSGRTEAAVFAWLSLAFAWTLLGLNAYEPDRTPLLRKSSGSLTALYPLFAAGVLIAVVTPLLFRLWERVVLPAWYLAATLLLFVVASQKLSAAAMSLMEVAAARVTGAIARIVGPVLFVLLALRFGGSYKLAAAAFFAAVVSLLAAWRRPPRVFTPRDLYAYQGGLLLGAAWMLAAVRTPLPLPLSLVAASAAVPIALLLLAGLVLREQRPALGRALSESASLTAILAVLVSVVIFPPSFGTSLVLGSLTAAAAVAVFAWRREPHVLFTIPVVLGYWLYTGQVAAGIGGEALGIAWLVAGLACAWAGTVLLARGSRWFEILHFMWFLCTAVATVLFYPFSAVGGWLFPLWGAAYLLVAQWPAVRAHRAAALVIEMAGHLLAVAAVAIVIWNRMDGAAAAALLLYAAVYAAIAILRGTAYDLYPATLALVGAVVAAVSAAGEVRVALPWLFIPVAALLQAAWWYGMRAVERSSGRAVQLESSKARMLGRSLPPLPFALAAGAGSAAGAALFLFLPTGAMPGVAAVTALAYFGLFAVHVRTGGSARWICGAALALAFGFYEILPALRGVGPENHLAIFVAAPLIIAAAGAWRRWRRDDERAWPLFAAATVATLLASFFAIWLAPSSLIGARVVLLAGTAVWLLLLVSTTREAFVYLATLSLAMMGYNFVQSSSDLFARHLVSLFLAGVVLLGVIFFAGAIRGRLSFREPQLLVAERWTQKVAYGLPVVVLGVAVFGSWGVTTSSNPYFCGGCHDMGGYFANWKTSPHGSAQVGCEKCHYDAGLGGFARAKIKGSSQLVAMLTGTQALKPAAHVADDRCLQCHSMARLNRPVRTAGAWGFNHASHLGGRLARGPARLQCTTCHTDTGTEVHFAIDRNVCFTCHFQTLRAPSPALSDCVSCHDVPTAGAMDHREAGIERSNEVCTACHSNVVAGSTSVEERRCRHCHAGNPGGVKMPPAPELHRIHVGTGNVGCDWCHGVVRHGRIAVQIARR